MIKLYPLVRDFYMVRREEDGKYLGAIRKHPDGTYTAWQGGTQIGEASSLEAASEAFKDVS